MKGKMEIINRKKGKGKTGKKRKHIGTSFYEKKDEMSKRIYKRRQSEIKSGDFKRTAFYSKEPITKIYTQDLHCILVVRAMNISRNSNHVIHA